ncbi:MAG: acyl carrier protein [Spirochaetes bacterium]|nr:acyl carrier protein [Spirochaetota bacterium]
MDKKEIQDKLVDILGRHTQIDTANVNPDQHLKYDLGLDSLDVAEMVYEIEEEFGISISDESAEKIQKISDTVDFIYDQLQSAGQEGMASQEN